MKNFRQIFVNLLAFTAGVFVFINIRIFNAFLAICAVYFIIQWCKNRVEIGQKVKSLCKLQNLPKNIRKNVIEILILSGFSCFSSLDMMYSLTSYVSCLFLWSIIYILWGFFGKTDIKITKFFAYGFITATLVLTILYVLNIPFMVSHDAISSMLAGKSLTMLMIVFWLMVREKNAIFKVKYQNAILLTVYLLIAYITIKNHSFTSKMTIILSPIVYILFQNLSRKIAVRAINIASAMVLIGVPLIVFFIDMHWVFNKFPNMEPSFKHRICIAKYSMEKFTENPVSGNGFKAARLHNSQNPCFTISEEGWQKHTLKHGIILPKSALHEVVIPYNAGFHAHNFIIQILFEIGIFGIIVLWVFIRNILKNLPEYIYKTNEFAANMAIISCLFTIYIFAFSLWESWILTALFALFYIFKTRK